MSHLLLIDASAFAYRSYYAFAASYRDDGLPTWATLGFMQMVWRVLGAAEADKPTHGAAVFDAPGKNFRHKLYPAYKANRDPARALEILPQLPYMRHAAEVLGLTPVEAVGFEADDVIATLAARAARAGMRTTIVSSDKDFGQLVRDNVVEIVDPMQRRRLLEADILKKFGVEPRLVPDVQALAGDTVDGIPGIKGVGKDKASRLINRFGSVEEVLRRYNEVRWFQVRAELKHKAADARLFLKLTTLRKDVPLPVKMDDLKLQPIIKSHLREMVHALGAAARMESMFALDPQLIRIVPPAEDPFEWWREELAAPGQKVPEQPQCGFYERRLAKGCPFVAARIWREPELDPVSGEPIGQEWLRCEVGGKARDPLAEWVRLSMKPIKQSDYNFEIADCAHAKAYRPGDPKVDPTKAIDILKMPAQFPPATKKRRKGKVS